VPKKAVAIFFFAALLGAAIFVYFTFPRTKDEIPKSNNQRPFPSAPGPNNMPPEPAPVPEPAPEPLPHPTTPKVSPGPTLRVMAWATGNEAKALEAEADAFQAATGRGVSMTIVSDAATYRHDLHQAMASDSPPDLCLIDARDFSGTDPTFDLADVTPNPGSAPRSVIAFTIGGKIKAVPDEFSVEVLFYNPAFFDQAGIGYPGPHWTWDTLEAMTRAIASLKIKNDAGQMIYPLELPANFDFWNILCTQAGHSAHDLDAWHLADSDDKDSQMRALDFIHTFFQELTVTAPLPNGNQPPGQYFAQQDAALLIASSSLTATLPAFHYAFTVLPSDLTRASLARVNGWAIPEKSTQQEAAQALATYLAWQPVHAGWSSVQKPPDGDSPASICYGALGQSLLPRTEPKTIQLTQFLDQQINQLARNTDLNSSTLYARIQNEYQGETSAPAIESGVPRAAGGKPDLQVPGGGQLRGF
jgi:ABC-type glycerol-3-phosphate transport system substrate-binding protein